MTRIPDKELFRTKLLTSNVKRSKIVAIAFASNGTIITSATNRCCRGHNYKWTIHAEESLINKLWRIKARERFGKINILVARWSPVLGWSNAKPCAKCQKAIDKFGAEVYHTKSCGNIVKVA